MLPDVYWMSAAIVGCRPFQRDGRSCARKVFCRDDGLDRAYRAPHERRDPFGLGEGDEHACAGVLEDGLLPACVGHEVARALGRVERDRYGTDRERAEECIEERSLGAQHQRYAIAFRDAKGSQSAAEGPGACEKIPVRDAGLRVVVVAQLDVDAVRCLLRMPADRVEQRARRRRDPGGGRRAVAQGRSRLRECGCGPGEGVDEISRRSRVGDDRVREAHSERALEAEQQLDTLEAADPEIAVEGIIERRRTCGRSTELGHEACHNVEHPIAAGRTRSVRNSHRNQVRVQTTHHVSGRMFLVQTTRSRRRISGTPSSLRCEVHKKSLRLSEVYRLLEPGPVVLVTTAHKDRANIMTMSWHMMIDFEPPIVGCVISNRNHTFNMLKTTGECVINIPTMELAEQVVGCGNTSGRRVDKFKRFRLTPLPAACVASPLIDECYANLECTVVDRRLVAAYNLFILQVQKAWVDPSRRQPRTIHHRGRGVFMVAGRTITLASRRK